MRRNNPKAEYLFESHLIHLVLSVDEPCVHVLKEFSMWNDIQPSQLRLVSWNWLNRRRGETIRKRNTFLKATLVILCVSINELCVHVPKEFSLWNDIQPSQIRLGSWNWLDPRSGETIWKRHTFLIATLVTLFVSCNDLCVHVQKGSTMWNDIQHPQLRLGSWNWCTFRWGERIRKWNTFWKPP